MGKSNKSYTRMLVIFGLVFPLGGAIFCSVSMGAAFFVPTLFILYLCTTPVVIYFFVKRNTGKTWDGEVTDFIHKRKEKGPDIRRVVCRTDAGKKVTIKDEYGMYSYLNKGDRVRFHPRLNVPLEKYDKTHDTYLMCPFCGREQPLDVDYCTKCGKPLLK